MELKADRLTGSVPSIHQWLSHQINGLRVVRATERRAAALRSRCHVEMYTPAGCVGVIRVLSCCVGSALPKVPGQMDG